MIITIDTFSLSLILAFPSEKPDEKIKSIKDFVHIFPEDDLRNYSYEGDGSSSESLGSVFTGRQFC